MQEACNGDERAVRAALGDAMSLNALMRLLGKVLFSAGVLAEVPVDPWRQMAKDMSQCTLGSCRPRVLPDSYVEVDRSVVR
jgi:hypothetical protein